MVCENNAGSVDAKRRYLPTSGRCFVCGEENAAGLQARFYVEDGVVKTRLRPRPHHCGFENIVHGGIIATLLDECMSWAATRAFGRLCVTGELTVRYLERVPCDRVLTVCAEVIKHNRRLAYVIGTLTDDGGVEYARAQSSFVAVSVEETLEVDERLVYRGDEERVFDKLRAGHEAQGSVADRS